MKFGMFQDLAGKVMHISWADQCETSDEDEPPPLERRRYKSSSDSEEGDGGLFTDYWGIGDNPLWDFL